MTIHRAARALAALVLVACTTAAAGAAARQQPITAPPTEDSTTDGRVFVAGVRLQDEIVVVNTRTLCGRCDADSLRTGLVIETYAADESGHRAWQHSELDTFLAFDPSVPTIIFVHGNQLTAYDAKHEGLAIYRRLIRYEPGAPRIRLVIFSWPSARIGGLLRDVRVKAVRTGPAGCQLAWLLAQMPPETPVTLVGFSYGSRIITGGLHILAGGRLGHFVLHERPSSPRAPVNVVLMSAALHANWLCPGQYHGLAMTQVNRMFLLNNCRDRAMRFYHLAIQGRGRPQALGLRGPTCLAPDHWSKVEMRDLSGYVGIRHDVFLYLCAPGVPAHIWEYALGSPSGLRLQAAM